MALPPSRSGCWACATTTTTTPSRSQSCCASAAFASASKRRASHSGARIRKAKLEKIPYIVVVGDDDVANATVGVNARGSNDPERGVSASRAFATRLEHEIRNHASPEVP